MRLTIKQAEFVKKIRLGQLSWRALAYAFTCAYPRYKHGYGQLDWDCPGTSSNQILGKDLHLAAAKKLGEDWETWDT